MLPVLDETAADLSISPEDLQRMKHGLAILRASDCDEVFTTHTMRTGPLARMIAPFYGAPVTEAFVSATMHDIGKGLLDPDLIAQSANHSTRWGNKERAAMDPHSRYSGELAMALGFEDIIANSTAQHHAFQQRFPVDNHVVLDEIGEALAYTNMTADHIDAATTRSAWSPERDRRILDGITFAAQNYYSGADLDEVVHTIFAQAAMIEAEFQA